MRSAFVMYSVLSLFTLIGILPAASSNDAVTDVINADFNKTYSAIINTTNEAIYKFTYREMKNKVNLCRKRFAGTNINMYLVFHAFNREKNIFEICNNLLSFFQMFIENNLIHWIPFSICFCLRYQNQPEA